MGGNSHDGARSIAHQHIICHPNGNLGPVDWVDGITACENACLAFGQVGTVEIAFQRGIRDIIFDSLLLFRGSDFSHQFVLGGHHHVGCAKERIGTGRIDT